MFGHRTRHPVLEALARLNRPFARNRYSDHEALFRALFETDLYVPGIEPPERDDVGRPVSDDEVMPVELEDLDRPGVPIAVACLDEETVRREFSDATGVFEMTGAEVCRAARLDGNLALHVYGPRRGQPELTLDWDIIEWLGADLKPRLIRLGGRRKVLHRVPGLVDACLEAVANVPGLLTAELYQGVGFDGQGHPVVLIEFRRAPTPDGWFSTRTAIESRIRHRGHEVPVVSMPEELVQDDDPGEHAAFANPAVDLLEDHRFTS